MKNVLSRVKYPKFLILILTFILAYFLVAYSKSYESFYNILLNLGYFGIFLAGIFFTYGFTAAPATAILLILAREQNIFLSGITAGFGALIGDLIIFSFIRYGFKDEINRIQKERIFMYINKKIPKVIRKYILPVFAGFIIASPLPDEIGVALLATSKRISFRFFSLISYVLNTVGLFILLWVGKLFI